MLGCRRDPRPHPPVLADPWEAVCSALKSASVGFAAENGRSVALVIDGAEFLTRNQDFTQRLVGYAKVSLGMRLRREKLFCGRCPLVPECGACPASLRGDTLDKQEPALSRPDVGGREVHPHRVRVQPWEVFEDHAR